MSKKKKGDTSARYDEAAVAKIVKFMKNHNNVETKAEFGCSTHFAGALRKKHKVGFPESNVRPTIKQALKKDGKKKKSLL